jgi:hypothetical protein
MISFIGALLAIGKSIGNETIKETHQGFDKCN